MQIPPQKRVAAVPDILSIFDPVFYLAANPDVAASGLYPSAHFLAHGRFEGRAPHALFDATHYLERNPDVAAAGIDPLAHYLAHGWREGRAHHPLFDAGFYRATNSDVAAAGVDPFAHYLGQGWREGRSPHPLFDVAFYRAANPDVAAAGVEQLAHFLNHGRFEGRAPHALFDPGHYLARNPDVAASGLDPVRHYAEHGWREGRDHHPLFDPAFYRAANPDVAAAGADPFEHFMRHGWREGRDPSAAFSLAFYALANPDVAAAGVNLLVHYARFGQAEGRAFAPGQLGVDGRILGTDGPDLLVGGFGAERLEGFAGDDTLAGGPGADTLIGGEGADLFVIDAPGNGVDRVEDFDLAEGDVLDLGAALAAAGFDPDLHALDAFVQAQAAGGDTTVSLRPPGGAPGAFAPAAVLAGASLTLDDLRDYGVLTEAGAGLYQLVDTPYGFTDTFDTTSDIAITPDGRFVVWTDLHDFDDPPEQPEGGIGFNLVKLANIAASGPAQAQADRQRPVSVDRNGDAVTGSVLGSVSDDGRVVGYTHRISSGDFNRTFWIRDMADPEGLPQIAARNAGGAVVAAQLGKLSGDGTHAVFLTDSGGMGGGLDFNGTHDVYLRDMATGLNTLVSVAANGFAGGSGYTFSHEMHAPDLSADGRYVVFASDAALTADDTDAGRDVYLRDTVLGVTILLSGGAPGEAGQPTISRDGRVVAFTTDAALDDDDGNGINDVYVVRLDGLTILERFRLSEAVDGREGADRGPVDHFEYATFAGLRSGESYAPKVSPDGSAVAFVTRATEILAVDGAEEARLAIRDLGTGGFGTVATPLFTSFSGEETAGIRAVKHGLTESGERVVYRIEVDGEDTPLVAPVLAVPAPADTPGSGLRVPRLDAGEAWRDGLSDVMVVRHGSVDARGDVDRFQVSATSDILDAARLRITLEGDHRWGDGLADPLLTIRSGADADVILFQNDDRAPGLPDSLLTFATSAAAGGFFIDVEGAGGAVGDYTLRIQELPPAAGGGFILASEESFIPTPLQFDHNLFGG